jgi:hypothetical protein
MLVTRRLEIEAPIMKLNSTCRIKELNRSVVSYALAFAVCLSACGQAYADSTFVPVDRSLFEGVFSGNANVAESPTHETFEFYDGTLPGNRDPSFWGLFGDHTGNRWLKYLKEEHVYNALLRHKSRDGKKDWEIGIGNGGQLYSWRGRWGEAIPPHNMPWNDEVWQATAHSQGAQAILNAIREHDVNESNLRGTVGEAFVHGSAGCDRDAPPGKSVFFCPMLAQWYDKKSKSYTVVN